jgi:predicted ArsR family transcriptional regulator
MEPEQAASSIAVVMKKLWPVLEELESEVVAFVKKTGSVNPIDLADGVGLSRSGARFIITKLRREEKL